MGYEEYKFDDNKIGGKGDKPTIIINMKNYIIENKKNDDKLLIKNK